MPAKIDIKKTEEKQPNTDDTWHEVVATIHYPEAKLEGLQIMGEGASYDYAVHDVLRQLDRLHRHLEQTLKTVAKIDR